MPTADSLFSHVDVVEAQRHPFGLLLIFALIIASSLWYWRPEARKSVMTSMLFFMLAFCSIWLCDELLKDFKVFAQGLRNVSIFILGMASIRLFGLLMFRLVLPLCRISLLSIIEDLVELAAYCAWLIIHLHNSGLNISGLITTSALITAVLAFSMQETLGNILGGLALQLDRSVKIGDWITVDEVSGRVIDIRWRYTAIETRNWETVVIPNSLLMKGKFSVLGRRSGQPLQWRRWVYFEVGYEHFVSHIIDITQNAVRHGHIPNVANTPAASCVLVDFNPSAARYAIHYWLQDMEQDESTDSLIRTTIFAALQRAGIDLPYPQQYIHLTRDDDKYENDKQFRRIQERIHALQQVPLFDILNDDELLEIAEQLTYTPFVKGDIMMRQGDIAHWLYIMVKGVADVFLELPEGGRKLINTLQGGCLLGEMGLMTGDPRRATVIAQADVLAYRLDKAAFQKTLANRPELAEEISRILVSRRFSIDDAQQQLDKESLNKLMASQQKNFLKQIRGFFGLDNQTLP
jgi:small-conductance mechanosensitive channel/CRP-like cAMP-binding protein